MSRVINFAKKIFSKEILRKYKIFIIFQRSAPADFITNSNFKKMSEFVYSKVVVFVK